MNWTAFEGEEGEPEQSGDTVFFDELYDVSTSFYDPHVLTLGVELKFWGGDETQYPNSFPISMTNHIGETISTNLMQEDEVMDLLAYILSGGDRNHRAFK